MRRWWIIAGTIFGVIAFAFAILLVWATFNLDSMIAAKRELILTKASDALGRKVEVANIRASFGWGVSIDLRGVIVADDPAFSTHPLLTVEDIYCSVELIPLLSRDLRIRSLNIANPELRIIRNNSGELNVSTIGKRTSAAAESQAAEPDSTKPSALKKDRIGNPSDLPAGNTMESAPLKASPNANFLSSLYVRDLTVTNGTISYSDPAWDEKPLVIKDFDFKISNFDVNSNIGVSLALAALGDVQNFRISGTAGPLLSDGKIDIQAVPVAFTIDAGPLTLASLGTIARFERALPPDLSIDGALAAHGKVTGTSGVLQVDIASDLGGNPIRYGTLFDKPAGVPFSITALSTIKAGSFGVERTNVTLADLIVKVSKIMISNGNLSARIDSNRFDLGPIASLIAPIRKYQAVGAAELHADIAMGGGAQPNINGTLALTGVGLSPGGKIPALADLSGDVKMAGNSADVGPLAFTFGGGHARLQARAKSIQPLDSVYAFDADLIRPALIVPSRPADEEIRNLKLSGTASGSPAAIIATATGASTTGRVNNIAYSSLSFAARLASKALTVESLKLSAFNGTIAAAGRAELAGTPKFDLNTIVNNIDLRQALSSQKSKAADIVRGSLTGTVHVAGAGKTFDEMKPAFRGNGRVAIRGGKLVGVNVVASALRKVDNIPGIGALIPMAVVERHPELFRNPDTDIDQASLSFLLTGPRISTNDLTVTSADYGILGKGWFDMDKNIDMAAHILLTQQFSSEIAAAKKNAVYLENRDGQIDIPLQMTGTLPKPAIAPDVGQLAQQAASQAMQRKGQKFLNKLGGFLGGSGSGGKNKGGNSGGSANPLQNLF
jgi:hypothetical protein